MAQAYALARRGVEDGFSVAGLEDLAGLLYLDLIAHGQLTIS